MQDRHPYEETSMGEQRNFTNAKIAVIVHMQINAKKEQATELYE